jgi:undecaprenyl-diphosphatase
MPAVRSRPRQVARSPLFPLIAVTGSALLFAVLLILLRARWALLASADRSVAAQLHGLVADRPPAASVLQAITWAGSSSALWMLVVAGLVMLAVRRRFRLALFLAVAGVGALILDPILKSLVGHPVAHPASGIPGGRALASIACYAALIVVFLPAIPTRARRPVTIVAGAPVAAVGVSRLILGAQYLSDILCAWALGLAWLGVTVCAFEMVRSATGQRVTKPLTEGLEPEAAPDLASVPDRRAGSPRPTRIGAGIVVAWTLILGVVVGFGELVTRYSGGNLAGDHTIPHGLAAHRTATLTALSAAFSAIGATQTILAVTVLAAVLFLAVTRRWRPVGFIVLVMLGEGSLFATTQAIVKRQRPDVVRLEDHIPTSSYPSGHVAATICIYVAIAILVVGHTRRWWRWLFVALAVLMPVLVATGRMYRGMHHPTDVLGSTILAVPLIVVMVRAVRPSPAVAGPPSSARAPTRRPVGTVAAASTVAADRDARPHQAVPLPGAPRGG